MMRQVRGEKRRFCRIIGRVRYKCRQKVALLRTNHGHKALHLQHHI